MFCVYWEATPGIHETLTRDIGLLLGRRLVFAVVLTYGEVVWD